MGHNVGGIERAVLVLCIQKKLMPLLLSHRQLIFPQSKTLMPQVEITNAMDLMILIPQPWHYRY
jgi:hypothetical protein